jgi:hypothetical protein
MEIYILLIALLAGVGLGVIIGRNISAGIKKSKQLDIELEQAKDELNAYRNKVTNHFEESANLVNSMTASYSALYEHLAKSSYDLCGSDASKLTATVDPQLPKNIPATPSQESAEETASEQTEASPQTDVPQKMDSTEEPPVKEHIH